MDSLITSRLAAIENKEAIQLYFKLLKLLLDDLNLHPQNPKLALTVPKSRNDFVVNLNSRWVLNLHRDGSIAFMIGKRDFRQLQRIVKAARHLRYSSCLKPDDYFATYSYDQLTSEQSLQAIVECWMEACRAFEPVMRRSPYRKFHNEEFYEMASGRMGLGISERRT
jgi:hypothetical protein